MFFLQILRTAVHRSQALWWTAVLAFLAASASAQPFVLRVQEGTAVANVTNGASVTLSSSGIGRTATATLTVTYEGTATANFNNPPSLTPPTADFSATVALPVSLTPGNSFTVALDFTPSTTAGESTLLVLSYTEGATQGTIQLTLIGATANMTVSYTLPPNQNTVPLSPGGTVPFPATQINTSTTGTIAVSNTGVGPGIVTAVSIPSGAAFQLVGVPLLPATLNPSQSLVFQIKYTPSGVGTDTGTLSINIAGTTSTYVLSGSGITSSYTYTITKADGTTATITPTQKVQFPDTALGSTSSFFVQVRNTGGASGVINSVNATGVFTITDAPPIFPVTLNANGQLTFTVTFTPVLPGSVTAKLTVGSDVFDLVGTGLGPKLTYSYVPATGIPPVTVLAGGTVVLSQAQVGQFSQASFTLSNAGTAAATVTSVAVADTKGVFNLTGSPSGPMTLNPNDSLTFVIVFTPETTGISTTTLQVDTQTFTLSGSGSAPPTLPAFQFTGDSGNVTPLQQPAVGITLAAPYPLNLSGVLTISINSAVFVPDASVQFASGGKTVTFTIPANTTQAIFPNGATSINLQVGTTAETITVTPSFATSGGLDLTPQNPATVSFTLPPSAPQLSIVEITNVTQTGFSVGVTGLATTHSLRTLTFQFTATGSGKSSSYSVDVSGQATLWYNSTAAQQFGGQFSVSTPFTIPNPSTTALSTANLKSVSVTAVNAQGTSSPVSFTIQ
jgi:hypothetical protein